MVVANIEAARLPVVHTGPHRWPGYASQGERTGTLERVMQYRAIRKRRSHKSDHTRRLKGCSGQAEKVEETPCPWRVGKD